jgi:hypothetical protein
MKTMSALVMLALVVGGCGESGEEQDTLNRGNEAVGQDQGGVDMAAPDAAPDLAGELDAATDEDMAPDAMPDAEMAPVGCGADHPKVGWTAKLSTRQHGVSGDAVIVDNCTVEVRNFKYDGQGIDVRVYGATGTNYRDGWIMTEDLVRRERYNGETIVAKMPEGKSLDALDAVSVWCVDFAIDFGSGSFTAP